MLAIVAIAKIKISHLTVELLDCCIAELSMLRKNVRLLECYTVTHKILLFYVIKNKCRVSKMNVEYRSLVERL